METNCAGCECKVKAADNYMKAHLWASTAKFHWTCFGTLLREHGATAAERATWNGSRDAAQPPADVDRFQVGK
jgi:hypothetical protein